MNFFFFLTPISTPITMYSFHERRRVLNYQPTKYPDMTMFKQPRARGEKKNRISPEAFFI